MYNSIIKIRKGAMHMVTEVLDYMAEITSLREKYGEEAALMLIQHYKFPYDKIYAEDIPAPRWDFDTTLDKRLKDCLEILKLSEEKIFEVPPVSKDVKSELEATINELNHKIISIASYKGYPLYNPCYLYYLNSNINDRDVYRVVEKEIKEWKKRYHNNCYLLTPLEILNNQIWFLLKLYESWGKDSNRVFIPDSVIASYKKLIGEEIAGETTGEKLYSMRKRVEELPFEYNFPYVDDIFDLINKAGVSPQELRFLKYWAWRLCRKLGIKIAAMSSVENKSFSQINLLWKVAYYMYSSSMTYSEDTLETVGKLFEKL